MFITIVNDIEGADKPKQASDYEFKNRFKGIVLTFSYTVDLNLESKILY
jgi:hypothetical protein